MNAAQDDNGENKYLMENSRNPGCKDESDSNLMKYRKFKRGAFQSYKVFVEQYFPIFKRKLEQMLMPKDDEQKSLFDDFDY